MKTKMTIVIMTIMLSGTVNAQVMGNWRYNGQRIEVAQIAQALSECFRV